MVDDVPKQHVPEQRPGRQYPELARIYARAHRIDDGTSCVLLVAQEDDTWSIHGHGADLPAQGVRVTNDAMRLLVQQIVKYSP